MLLLHEAAMRSPAADHVQRHAIPTENKGGATRRHRVFIFIRLDAGMSVNPCSGALRHYSDLSITDSTGGAVVDFWSSGERGYVRIMGSNACAQSPPTSQSIPRAPENPFDYVLFEFRASRERGSTSHAPTLGRRLSRDHQAPHNLGCMTSDDITMDAYASTSQAPPINANMRRLRLIRGYWSCPTTNATACVHHDDVPVSRRVELDEPQSWTNKYLHRVAFARAVWVSLVEDLRLRGFIDRLSATDIRESSAERLIGLVKTIMTGAESWPSKLDHGRSESQANFSPCCYAERFSGSHVRGVDQSPLRKLAPKSQNKSPSAPQ
ncbi:hypothetical protein C8R44DRAFT_886155 [Mycena epipterygia]|nr:hypothetical protein C8R44DRAFT_886155 [Mycena epipterygia]